MCSSPAAVTCAITLTAAPRQTLDEVTRNIDWPDAGAEILYGRADEALIAYAEAAGAELIAVGARGHGASRTFFGSTAERLVGRSPVPVLVGRRNAI